MLNENGSNKQSVWRVTGSPFTGSHCATFPPELIEPIILTSSPKDGVVFDPFGGSGTVGLVCRQHERRFLLCDISSENVELAKQRISEGITNNDRKRLSYMQPTQPKLPMIKEKDEPKSKDFYSQSAFQI